MRLTNSMVMRSTLFDLNASLRRLQDSQTDLSTGKVIRKVSDDPARAMDAVAVRGELRRTAQHSRTADSTAAWLQMADTALVSGHEVMLRAKELVVRATNGATADPSAREAMASELESIRTEMLAIANTEHLGRSIFNGTAAGSAYDAAGLYVGNDATITREVATGVTMTANLTGEQIFGAQAAPSGDMFAVLDRLATSIRSGDLTAMATDQTNLDVAMERLSSASAEIGSRAARLEGVQARTKADEVTLQARLSLVEDADLAESLIAVQANETAYTAALQAASMVMPPSLLDYLR